ncbi:hypothetical protein [uncultured Methanospirillum sp.]|uniref:hypothetical protein n=1 Tax=uncultured Methanospirillum sp. TaxID=262503 RepID=UPI0029C6B589|nr:hypothetical protein [uncultured Methanospirillum sp.]
MNTEEIRSILEKEGITKELPCGRAFEISEKYGVSKSDIAKFCNEQNIKIRACQLGCF